MFSFSKKNNLFFIFLFLSLFFFFFSEKEEQDSFASEANTEPQTQMEKEENTTKTNSYAKEYGGKLLLASIGEPSNLIPPLASDSASSEVNGFIYTSLLRYDKEYNIIKNAAEEYEVLDGGRLFRFKLREDILWQDGKPLTADDVTFTYELMINPNTPTAYAADYKNVAEFKQIDKYRIEVRYEEAFARAPITWMRAILPKHILEKENLTATQYARNPIGAGPFKLKEWKAGNRIILEASDTYFKGRPYLDEIVYRIIPDASTIFLEAKAGRLDMLGLSPQQYLRQTLSQEWKDNWNKFKYLANGYTYVGFNLDHPLFKNIKIREALSYATDRKALVKGALLGLGEPTVGPYKPGSWVYNTDLEPYSYNPEKAKALFAEEGWVPGEDGILEKDGLRFSFTLLINQGNKEREHIAIILQQYWQAVGVDIKIRTVEWATFITEFINKKNFEAIILAWNILDDPDIFDVWHSSATRPGGLNFVNYKNKEVDSLLEKARITVSQEERKIYYDAFQEILYRDKPYLFLYVPYSLPMIQKRIQDVEESISGVGHNMDMWWIPKELQHLSH